MNEKMEQIKEMTEQEQIEEIKLIIAENMATYSKAKMPYEEALKFCALGMIASGYRKESETAKEILKILNEIGGCDSTDEYFKGWDAAIDGAYKAIKEKFCVEVEE